jgi:hypothetical protein
MPSGAQSCLPGGQRAVCRICRFKALLPLEQRVSEWQAISVTQGEIPRDAS